MLTQEIFIKRAQAVHGDKYDYSSTVYKLTKKPVIITCPIHGDFTQRPAIHLTGGGCPMCYNSRRSKHRTKTTEQFIAEAKAKHGNTYTYDKSQYTTSNKKITITCPTHGDFEQIATNHLKGQGCPYCWKGKPSPHRSTTEKFVQKANDVHNSTYTYAKTKYTTSINKVTITCNTHGDFIKTPNEHLSGQGCPQCAKLRDYPVCWSHTGWTAAGQSSKNFKGYSVYVLECWNENERFLKIGKTYTDIAIRYAGKAMPYTFKVLLQVYGEGITISKLETEAKKAFKSSYYTPSIPFGGLSECFNFIDKDNILTYIQQ